MILEQLAHGIFVIGEIPLGDKPTRAVSCRSEGPRFSDAHAEHEPGTARLVYIASLPARFLARSVVRRSDPDKPAVARIGEKIERAVRRLAHVADALS